MLNKRMLPMDFGHLTGLVVLLSSCLAFIHLQSHWPLAQAQDLLRNRQQQQQPINNNKNQRSPPMGANPLDNIQLPPQLASLSPQQLHQLAQLREMQLQQQAQQQQQQQSADNQAASAPPPPLGLEQLPTAQPTGVNNAQIPQPIVATNSPSPPSESNDRHDDGSYNESGSEMEGVAPASTSDSAAAHSNQAPSESRREGPASSQGQQQQQQAAAPAQPAAPTFEVNWNKCPQLEPGEAEKNKKTQVITKCLQSAPIPTNLTRESVEAHREQIATCALGVEGWFDDKGNYKYDKAENEIRGKKLEPGIENQVLKFHIACKDEASKKFPREQNKLIDQVQFYQACMDYYISIVCEIEVSVDQ